MWLGIVTATGIWSVTLWGLQLLWKWTVKETTSGEFMVALLYGASALLEKSSLDPSINVSGQVSRRFLHFILLSVDSIVPD